MFQKTNFDTILPYTYPTNSFSQDDKLINRFLSTIYSYADKHRWTNEPEPETNPISNFDPNPDYWVIWIDSTNDGDKIASIV
jgi:hypothetical protein